MLRILILSILLTLAFSCPPSCFSCDLNICTACQDSYELSIDGTCLPSKNDFCSLYSDHQCSQCYPTFALQNGSCLKQYSGCIKYDDFDSSLCTKCSFGKILINNQCVGSINCAQNQQFCNKCKEGFVLSNSICLDKSASCINYNALTGVCLKCSANYLLIGYNCLLASIRAASCYIYNQNGVCVICKSGFSLMNGSCELTAQIDLVNNSSSIQPLASFNEHNLTSNSSAQNCQLFDPANLSSCLVCMPFYYSKNGFCTKISFLCGEYQPLTGECFSCNGLSLTLSNGTCTDPNCLRKSELSCLECLNNFTIDAAGVCQFTDLHCNITIAGLNRCDTCFENYYVDLNGRCQVNPEGCQQVNVANAACLQCLAAFQIDDSGKCLMIMKIDNCMLVDQINRVCISCNFAYYPNRNVCVKVSRLCATYDKINGNCLTCIVGYSMIGSNCIDPNCVQLQNDTCLECKANFKSIASSYCKYFDKNCAILTDLGCNFCNSGYYFNITLNNCTPMPLGCANFNTNGCTSCYDSYTLLSGLNTCVLSIAFCLKYDSFGSCSACDANYNLNGKICSKAVMVIANDTAKDANCAQFNESICVKCSTRYYFSNGLCSLVNPNCKSFDRFGNCTDCYSGYSLNDGTCVASSLKNDVNCKLFSNGTCHSCYGGYFLKIYTCTSLNPLCKTSDSSNGNCLSCFNGYLLVGGQCSIFFKDPNCLSFDSNNSCIKCSLRYFLTKSNCKAVSTLCKDYNSVDGLCTSCFGGYALTNGTCLVAVIKNADIYCKSKDSAGVCSQCYSNFYLSGNLSCLKVNPLCKNISSQGLCTDCYVGYILKNGSCSIGLPANADKNCKQASNAVCLQCYNGYYLSVGVCTQVNPACKTADLTNGYCLTCYSGYTPGNGTCLIAASAGLTINSQTNVYCLKWSGSNCLTCANSYFLSNNQCLAVDPLCKTYSSTSGGCLSCYSGYSLSGEFCKVMVAIYIPYCQILVNGSCVECISGYYVQNSTVCGAVSILCATYNQSTGVCTSCMAGYFLQGDSCIYPSMGFDAACIHYDASAYCERCQLNYYLNNYICTAIDPNCIDFDYTNRVCLNCQLGLQSSGPSCG